MVGTGPKDESNKGKMQKRGAEWGASRIISLWLPKVSFLDRKFIVLKVKLLGFSSKSESKEACLRAPLAWKVSNIAKLHRIRKFKPKINRNFWNIDPWPPESKTYEKI